MPWLIYMDLCTLFDGKALPNPLHHFASMFPVLSIPSSPSNVHLTMALDEFMVGLTLRPPNPTYSLIWSVVGPQSRSALSQKREKSRLCPESNPGLFSLKPTQYGQCCPVPLALISCRINLCDCNFFLWPSRGRACVDTRSQEKCVFAVHAIGYRNCSVYLHISNNIMPLYIPL